MKYSVGRTGAAGIGPEHLPEPQPRGGGAAAAELGQRSLVHRVGRRSGRAAARLRRIARRRRARRRGGVVLLRRARLELGPELAQPLLALAGELLQLHQLLLDVVEILRDIAL